MSSEEVTSNHAFCLFCAELSDQCRGMVGQFVLCASPEPMLGASLILPTNSHNALLSCLGIYAAQNQDKTVIAVKLRGLPGSFDLYSSTPSCLHWQLEGLSDLWAFSVICQ